MKSQVKIALTSDFNPDNAGHQAANKALQHAADQLGLTLIGDWIPTDATNTDAGRAQLSGYDGIFSAGGAYESKEGAIQAIRFAREQGRPFFAT